MSTVDFRFWLVGPSVMGTVGAGWLPVPRVVPG